MPHVSALAPALIVTALFDREINCRRAASAAFQENVGRQGNFPKGIEIIQLADYFSLGNRKDAYMTISYEVAKLSLEELGTRYYLKPMIDHLVNVKLFHWDISLRTLAALALRNLVELDRPYFMDVVLPGLVREIMHRTTSVTQYAAYCNRMMMINHYKRLKRLRRRRISTRDMAASWVLLKSHSHCSQQRTILRPTKQRISTWSR